MTINITEIDENTFAIEDGSGEGINLSFNDLIVLRIKCDVILRKRGLL